MFNVHEAGALFFPEPGSTKCYLMSFDHQIDIWEARFERKPEHKVYNRRAEPEMGNFKRRILLRAVNEASGREIKYHFITEGQGM